MKQYNANGHAMPKKSDGVTKLQSDELFQDDQNLPNCTPVVFGKSGLITQSTSDQECTANVPLVYGECTGGVLKRYWKGTTEVLRRYYRGTKDIPTACTSPVHPDRRDGEGMVGVQTYGRGSVRNQDVPQNMVCDIPSRRDMVRRGNPCGCPSHKRVPTRGTPTLTVFISIFICCLFNNAALAQSRDTLGAVDGVEEAIERKRTQTSTDVYAIVHAQKLDSSHMERTHHTILKSIPTADLSRFPVVKYTINKDSLVYYQLDVGEELPKELMQMPFQILRSSGEIDTISLQDYSHKKYLLLDFWAGYCVPCVKGMNKWQSILSDIHSDIEVIGVNMDFAYSTQPHAQRFGWTFPQVFGQEAYILNAFLLGYHVVGPTVWIKDGKLFGATAPIPDGHPILDDIRGGTIKGIPSDLSWDSYRFN